MGPQDHHDGPDGRHLRRVVTTEFLTEAMELYDASEHSLGAVVRYMERNHGLRINIHCIRSRIAARREEKHPRASETARLIPNLSADQASGPLLRFHVEKVGISPTLSYLWWAYPEFIRDDNTFGVVPGISIDGKALVNKYDLPLFTICGRTIVGRVHLFQWPFCERRIRELCSGS